MATINLTTLFRSKLGTVQLESINGLQSALAAKVEKSSVSDAVNLLTAGSVASSAAVKTTYDKALEALAAANAAANTASQALTGISNLPNAKSDSYNLDNTNCLATSKALRDMYQNQVLQALNMATTAASNAGIALNKWSNIPNVISDSISLDSSTTVASSKAAKLAYDKGAAALSTANSAAAGVQGAKDYALGLFNNRSDSVSSTSSSTLATSAAAYTAYNRQHDTLYYGGTARLGTTASGITVNGDAIFGGAIVSYQNVTAFSDRRLKYDIFHIEDALEKVLALSGYTFKWKGSDRPSIGVIAQEIQAIFPEIVFEKDDRLAVDYSLLVSVLIEAIKELNAKLEK